VIQEDDGNWLKRSNLYEANSVRDREILRMPWNQVVDNVMKECGVNKVDAQTQV